MTKLGDDKYLLQAITLPKVPPDLLRTAFWICCIHTYSPIPKWS